MRDIVRFFYRFIFLIFFFFLLWNPFLSIDLVAFTQSNPEGYEQKAYRSITLQDSSDSFKKWFGLIYLKILEYHLRDFSLCQNENLCIDFLKFLF